MRNYWSFALTISLIIHIMIFSSLAIIYPFNNTAPQKEKVREIKIIPHIVPEKNLYSHSRLAQMQKSEEPIPPPYINNLTRVDIIPQDELNLTKATVVEDNLKAASLASFPSEKILRKNPSYMNYYNLIREKIRKNAYEYYAGDENGEVLLTFVVMRNGRLSGVYMENSKSYDDKLVKIALKSIKDASPFPPFPPSLPYPRLKFNISIYFKSN